MRKVIASLFVSADGYATGRDPSDMDWVAKHQGPDHDVIDGWTRDTDLLVLGRVTYEIMSGYWPTADAEVEGDFVNLINSIPKMVFSKTLTEPLVWQNTTVNRGDVATEIPKLKEEPGKDIGITGSVELVRSLLRLGLLDRIRLLVYPTALGGTGTKPVFESLDRTTLRLVESKVLDSQVVLLDYEVT